MDQRAQRSSVPLQGVVDGGFSSNHRRNPSQYPAVTRTSIMRDTVGKAVPGEAYRIVVPGAVLSWTIVRSGSYSTHRRVIRLSTKCFAATEILPHIIAASRKRQKKRASLLTQSLVCVKRETTRGASPPGTLYPPGLHALARRGPIALSSARVDSRIGCQDSPRRNRSLDFEKKSTTSTSLCLTFLDCCPPPTSLRRAQRTLRRRGHSASDGHLSTSDRDLPHHHRHHHHHHRHHDPPTPHPRRRSPCHDGGWTGRRQNIEVFAQLAKRYDPDRYSMEDCGCESASG